MKIHNQNEQKKTIRNVKVGRRVKIYDFVNLYGCEIGEETKIGTFVEIQKNVKIGKKCRIQSHTFICEGVTIEDEVFIGHGVMFINDNRPTIKDTLDKTWKMEKITIKKGATIGTGAILLGGVVIGENAIVGAGAVVTRNVLSDSVVVGNPAKILSK